MGPVRQLAGLSQRDERALHEEREGSRKQKSPGFRRRHRIDLPPAVVFVHELDCLAKGVRLRQKRCNILEKDARFGKIRYIANVLREVHQPIPFATTIVVKGYGFVQEQATMPLTIRRATPADA